MKDIERSKLLYKNLEIPVELNSVVQRAIEEVTEKRRKEGTVSFQEEAIKIQKTKKGRNTIKKAMGNVVTTAAAMFLAFVIGLNSSEAFAMEMAGYPMLSGLVSVLTVRSYHGFDPAKGIQKDIEVPLIAPKEAVPKTGSLIETVNDHIQEIIDTHLTQAEQDFQEYKKAFLENGGSEEEWADRTMDLDVAYEVKYQKGDILSLVLYYSETSAFAYEKAYYYNMNLTDNRKVTLKDLLGENYITIANQQIRDQMETRMKEDENTYYWGFSAEDDIEMEGFTTVDEATDFYINEKGNPVVSFEEYQVAPGYMGIQEFEIIRQ